MKIITKFLMIKALFLSLACSPKVNLPYDPFCYDKMDLVQPIQVVYKDLGKSFSFELYLQKKSVGHRVFGIHSIIGRIFILDIDREKFYFVENLNMVDREILEQVFLVFSLKVENKQNLPCEIVHNINSSESIYLTLSSNCYSSKREKN